MPEPELVERIDELGSLGFTGETYRHIGPQYPPLSAEGSRVSGARWNPPESFPVLYMGLDVPTVIAEFYRLVARQDRQPDDLLPRRLYRYEVHLSSVLDLRQGSARNALGLSDADLSSNDLRACQAAGEAAHYLGLEGILAPSAVGPGHVLAVFYGNLKAGSYVHDLDYETWTAVPPHP
jgi:RES domain-containing protein